MKLYLSLYSYIYIIIRYFTNALTTLRFIRIINVHLEYPRVLTLFSAVSKEERQKVYAFKWTGNCSKNLFRLHTFIPDTYRSTTENSIFFLRMRYSAYMLHNILLE